MITELTVLRHHTANWLGHDVSEQLIDAAAAAVSAIVKIAEVRDPYTNEHQRRTSKIAEAIAIELGFDDRTCSRVAIGALLHDIGKIGIPLDLLSKTTVLTQYEYRLIQEHPSIGRAIVSDLDQFFKELSTIIYQHHERVDGSGYPLGLAGNEIMIEAKIISVSDVLESMSTHRPYRAAIGGSRAIDEILNGAGKKYDEDVSKAAISLYNNKKLNF